MTEITYPDQIAELEEALDRRWIQETRLEAILELQIFARANEQLGSGESACIALAEARNWVLGTDDSKGAKWKKVISAPGIRILNTPGILLLAIRQKVLTVERPIRSKPYWKRIGFEWALVHFRIWWTNERVVNFEPFGRTS